MHREVSIPVRRHNLTVGKPRDHSRTSRFRWTKDSIRFRNPILRVADTRFISRYVDGVVLAVLRDVSRIPKILATCEILGAFGVQTLGAVVTGSPEEVYYSDSRYGYEKPA